jgi:hypothetical protein
MWIVWEHIAREAAGPFPLTVLIPLSLNPKYVLCIGLRNTEDLVEQAILQDKVEVAMIEAKLAQALLRGNKTSGCESKVCLRMRNVSHRDEYGKGFFCDLCCRVRSSVRSIHGDNAYDRL